MSITVDRIYADPADTQALQLASTAVVPAARGRGIGVALI